MQYIKTSTLGDAGKGIYTLVLFLPRAAQIEIGKLATQTFERGWYVYFGSAHLPGGLYMRVHRHACRLGVKIEKSWNVDYIQNHARGIKKKRWNIDYFRDHANLIEAWVAYDEKKFECLWSAHCDRLGISSVPLKRMGGNDCKAKPDNFNRACPAHFYRLNKRPSVSLLRKTFSAQPIQVVPFEPHTGGPTSELEWEPDYWAGRSVLEAVRLRIYDEDLSLPSKLSNLTGNPVLKDLLARTCGTSKSRRALMLKQVKFAHAIDSLIETHGEPAFNVIFDLDKPQSREDIEAIARKSWDRQFERILQVSAWDEPSIGP